MIGPQPLTLVDELQRGERDAFVRFFELYRLPVYNVVLALTHAGEEAPSIVRDVFVSAYRQMLLAGRPVPIGPWTYRAAVAAAEDYIMDGGPVLAGDEAVEQVLDEAPSLWADGDLAGRFGEALDGLSVRDQAVLVLSDVYGLSNDDLGVVFDVSHDGARTLLFKAREAFRQAFEDVSSRQAGQACRLAEQAAAASVGHSLGADEERKLRRHAEYCTACRPVMAAWAAGLTGLALFLKEAPLPAALVEAPVFATPVPLPAAEKVAAVGLLIPFDRALRRTGGALASKAAAWAVAAVCLAATAGMALYVAQFDGTNGSIRPSLSATRQIPHGDRFGREAGVFPPQNGEVAVVRGEVVRTVTRSVPSGETDLTLLAGTTEVVSVSDRRPGFVSDGSGVPDGVDPSQEPGGGAGGGDVASGDPRDPRGGDTPTPAGNGRGMGSDKPQSGGNDNTNGGGKDKPDGGGKDKDKPQSGGNGNANAGGNSADKPAAKPAPAKASPPSKPKPSKPKPSKPKPTKQNEKPSKNQK